MEHSTEVLYNRTMVYCSPEHRFGSDALLLARFCEPKRAQKAADLCSGCGIVALEWHDRGHRGPCIGLELQPEGSALLSAAVEEQGIGHIEPVCADLRAFRQGEGSFDVCACNPPYFTDGPAAPPAPPPAVPAGGRGKSVRRPSADERRTRTHRPVCRCSRAGQGRGPHFGSGAHP